MFFKRLSRGSRSNSYAENEYLDSPRSAQDPHFASDRSIHDSPRQGTPQHNSYPPLSPTKESQRPDSSKDNHNRMYATQRQSQAPADPYSRAAGGGLDGRANGISAGRNSMHVDSHGPGGFKQDAAPDLLTRAFNEAVRPYTEKIEQLEAQVADMQYRIEELERERAEMHSWIDKRGLRPDVPPTIASQMDQGSGAAISLNAQLDRKITIVNFDLHRLQNDLNSSISTAHFASAMAKFLPDIARLTALPGGPKLSFDLILKLGGNLNSHGGLDSSDPEDIAARRDFYAQLDDAMVNVVKRRFEEEGDESAGWNVSREIKRIEKTAAYLRNFGVEPYFPRTVEAMRRETEYRSAGPGMAAPPHAADPPGYARN
ncbi:uncharacterized protein PV09_03218 [Verruconis gallopava]|uniref:Uncharacterized protein n=1 Tax=Verruconis gallopava TaxID=253628 RepID=A0A0D1YZD7_9PEZI|nr:uncharacterized protein PV09_03218 [Verruconis gallopava]KIW06042.1 hypothetical protein PV09_03218 [Verruconis gallopava]